MSKLKRWNWPVIFWLLVGGMFAYEFITLLWTDAPDDHITAIFDRMTCGDSHLVFGMGFLMGHIFWGKRDSKKEMMR